MKPLFLSMAAVLLLVAPVASVPAAQRLSSQDHVPRAISELHLKPTGRVPGSQHLHLAIGLRLRDQEALPALIRQLYEPASPNHRRYLTPAQFTERFAPTEQDYNAVLKFAESNRWTVTFKDSGRIVIGVEAAVSEIERACHVRLLTYQHPTEPRQFFAPDVEPTLDLAGPVLTLRGLNDFVKARPAGFRASANQTATIGAGSAPGGNLMGYDFRSAYAPWVSLDGTGQTIGLLEFEGYYTNDIIAYERLTGLPNVTLTNVLLQRDNGNPSTNSAHVGEVSLDIEMALSMAPGISQIMVFEAPSADYADEILAQMATNNSVSQFSSSWFFPDDLTTHNLFARLAVQGQSFFEASGDDAAYSNGIITMAHAGPPADDPYVTSVGGTTLTTSGPGGFWLSETVWNNNTGENGTNGSGGGISAVFTIPDWQTNTSMIANEGSTTMRNIPDVAMVADNVWVIYNNGEMGSFWGTSCAAPLWAAFTALVNQEAEAQGYSPVGFLNPTLYRLGDSSSYAAYFHDITTGNNTNLASPDLFSAVPGYDLCTGWGSPKGMTLIRALAAPDDSLSVSPGTDLFISGGVGGQFNFTNRVFSIADTGSASLSWSAASACSWLELFPVEGVLPPGGLATEVTVSLSPLAAQLAPGLYSGSIIFRNDTIGTERERQFTLQVGLSPITFDDLGRYNANGGAVPAGYAGLDWSNIDFLSAIDSTNTPNGYQAGMVSPENVVYNPNGNPASLIGVAPFDLISAYMTAAWRDDLLVEATGYLEGEVVATLDSTLSATAPTLVSFKFFGVDRVEFVTSGGAQHPGYQESGSQFVMDNVLAVVQRNPAEAPILQGLSQTSNLVGLVGTTQVGRSYQLQSTTDLSRRSWADIGGLVTATNTVMTFSDSPNNLQTFYRLLVLP